MWIYKENYISKPAVFEGDILGIIFSNIHLQFLSSVTVLTCAAFLMKLQSVKFECFLMAFLN